MTAVELYRTLISDGYRARGTEFSGMYVCECNTQGTTRLVLVVEEPRLFSNDRFIWYINNLVLAYGYSNILVVGFVPNSFEVRTRMPSVQYWIYNTVSKRLEIYENQPYEFYGVKLLIENYKRKTYNRFLNVNNIIVALNIIVFIVLEFIGDTDSAQFLYEHGGKTPESVIKRTEYYRYFTSMFMHSGIGHIFNNMLLLFFIGDNLERALGHIKYFILYFASGIIAGIVSQVYYYFCGDWYVVCIGASGAIFGVVGALIWALIVNKGRLENLSLSRMILYVVLSIGINVEGVNAAAHIGGLVGGFVLAMILYRRGAAYEN